MTNACIYGVTSDFDKDIKTPRAMILYLHLRQSLRFPIHMSSVFWCISPGSPSKVVESLQQYHYLVKVPLC